MISPSAYLFRARRRLEYGSTKPNARDLELLRAAAEGRLLCHQDFEADIYEYRMDGEVVDKQQVRRSAYYLGLITSEPRDMFQAPEEITRMVPSAHGRELLDPVTAGSPEPLLVASRHRHTYGSGLVGSGGQSSVLAALCRSEDGERFLLDYEHNGVTLSGAVIEIKRTRNFKDWDGDFRVWLTPDGTGKAQTMRLNVMGIQQLWTMPNPDGSATRSEQLRQTKWIAHDTLFADDSKYAGRLAALRELIGDGPAPATRALIETLDERQIPFRLLDARRAEADRDTVSP